MNLHYKKIFAWLLAVVLAVTSIPVSGRYSSDRILAGTTASSGNATTASGGAILLGDEEITSNISTPHTKDYFEIWADGKKVDGKNYKAIELSVSQPALATGSNTTKYTAGVVTSRSALADVKGGSTTVRTTPATAKYKNGTLTVTARGDSAAECYAYVVSYDSKDKSKAPLDIAFAKIVVHLAPSSLALNTDKSNVSVNNSTVFSVEPLRKVSKTENRTLTDEVLTAKLSAKPETGIAFLDASGNPISNNTIALDGKQEFKAAVTSFSGTKPATVTITATCVQNGKKASSKITVSNGVEAMRFTPDLNNSGSEETGIVDVASANATSMASGPGTVRVVMPNPTVKKATAKFSEKITSWAGNESTTDKNTIYRIGTADGFTFNNGKVEVTASPTKQQKKVTLKADKKSGSAGYTVTAAKGTAEGTIAYFLIYHNEEAYEIVAVGIGDSSLDDLSINKDAVVPVTLWANATNDTGSCSVSAFPGTYKDSKGKTVKGKLVWALTTQPKDSFSWDSSKHKFTDSSAKVTDKKVATVSKGLITAKGAGSVYVYALDTATGQIVRTVNVTVKESPTVVRLFEDEATLVNTKDAIEYKTATVPEGGTITIYARGATGKKNNYTASEPEGMTYKAVVPSTYAKANLVTWASGNAVRIAVPSGSFKALGGSSKAIKVPVSITASNGRSTTFNLMVGNPVVGFSFADAKDMVAQKASGGSYDVDFIMTKAATNKAKATATANVILTSSGNGVSTTTDKLSVIALGSSPANFKKNAKGALVVNDKKLITTAIKGIKLAIKNNKATVTVPKKVGGVEAYFLVYANSYNDGHGTKGYVVVKVTTTAVDDGTSIVGTGGSNGELILNDGDSVTALQTMYRLQKLLNSGKEKDIVLTYGGLGFKAAEEDYDFGIVDSNGDLKLTTTDGLSIGSWTSLKERAKETNLKTLTDKNKYATLSRLGTVYHKDAVSNQSISLGFSVGGVPEIGDTITFKDTMEIHITGTTVGSQTLDSNFDGDDVSPSSACLDENGQMPACLVRLITYLNLKGDAVFTYTEFNGKKYWKLNNESGFDVYNDVYMEDPDKLCGLIPKWKNKPSSDGSAYPEDMTISIKMTKAPTYPVYTNSRTRITATDTLEKWAVNSVASESFSSKDKGLFVVKTEAGQTFPDKPTVSDTYYAKVRYFVNRELSGKTFKYNKTKNQWISTDGAKAFDAINYSADGGVSTLFYNGAFTNFESSEYNNYSITFSKATIVVGGK